MVLLGATELLAQAPRNPMRDAPREPQDSRGSQTASDVDGRGIYPRDRKPADRIANPPQDATPQKPARPDRTATLQQAPTVAPSAANQPPQNVNRPQPFPELSAAEQKQVDEVLLNWERKCDTIKTFKSDFVRETYNQFGPKERNFKASVAEGEIKYQKPDHGKIQVTHEKVWDAAKGDYVDSTEVLEHWVCDGKNVYFFAQADKQLVENPVPKEMQGNAISQGPLPFVFGAKAADLKARYFIREDKNTPSEYVRLEIYPRFQADAANYRRVLFVLNRKTFEPAAIEMENPGQNNQGVIERDTYRFKGVAINSFAWKLLDEFGAPSVPRGWKKVVMNQDAEPASKLAQPPRGPDAPERK
jgi:TIGR03009 family protein